MTGPTVLCVSDDEQLRVGLRELLQPRMDDWDLRFPSVAEAVDLLAIHPVDVLVASLDAPGPNGRTLLDHAHTEHPEVARLVLSDRPDGRVQVDAVGATQQMLSKPCTPDGLESAIRLVLDLRNLVASESLRALFGAQDALAKPPHIYSQLVALSEDPNSSADDVVNLIQQDVGLAAEVLRLVNSAFYGQSTTVKSIEWAVVLLGLETLKSLAVAGVVFRPGQPLPAGLDSAELAARAVRASVTAQHIAHREHWDADSVSDVALSALLCEVGLLVLAPAHPQQWEQLLAAGDQGATAAAQLEAFGCTVGWASAYLLGMWGFPAGALAATAAQPLDMSDPDAVAAASPAALAVAFAHQKARGLAYPSLFAHSTYLNEHRFERWQAA